MKKEPIELQSTFFEEVWNKSDIDAVFKYFDGTAAGLGVSEAVDPVAYLDLFNAFNAAMKDFRIEVIDGSLQGERLFFRWLFRARATKRDRAVILECAAWSHYRDGKIVEAENFIDFMELFRQLGIVPEEAVELGLAGEEILQLSPSKAATRENIKQLFWPGYPKGSAIEDFSIYIPADHHLEVLFNSTNFGMFVSRDSRDEIVDVNDSVCRLLGRTRKELLGRPFSTLLSGKGIVAEQKAAKAIAQGKRNSYRLPLFLDSTGGPLRVWICAVKVPHKNESKILRSVQRPELLDDLVAFQCRQRDRLVERLDTEVLEPVISLWKQLTEPQLQDLGLKGRCVVEVEKLLNNVRRQIRELRNPILEGKSLRAALSFFENLDSSIDGVAQPTALVVYRILEEARKKFGARPDSAILRVADGWLQGEVSIHKTPDDTEYAACSDRCRLIGGRFSVSSIEPAKVCFEMPV